jgi:hypothetical protein
MGKTYFTDNENEAIVFDDESLLQAEKYWTEERMKKATPIGIELPKPPSMTDLEKEMVKGTVTKANIDVSPYNAGGKLFFSQGGKDLVGSAEFCGDKNLILTAAHCVRDMDTGKWSENIVFKRGYNIITSKQKCAIRAVAVKSYWYADKDYRWDYAFGISTSESKVDALPYQINNPFSDVTSFGYPSNYSLGIVMQKVDGVTITPSQQGIVCMQGNPMREGCSGGAWVKQNGDIISGVNSFYYKGVPGNLYGPLLTVDFDSLFNYAQSLK